MTTDPNALMDDAPMTTPKVLTDTPMTALPPEPTVHRYDHQDGRPPYPVVLKTDYDALRQAAEVLEAENRRLTAENAELQAFCFALQERIKHG